MPEKNKVTLKICGYDFILSSEDSPEYIRKIGSVVEAHIDELIRYSNSMSTTMAAIFAALEFCDEATKSRESADNLRSQIQEYLEDAAKAKNEAAEHKRREQELSRQVYELRSRLERNHNAR